MQLPRIATLALVALLLAGCSASLRTAPAAVDACDLALGGGQLVATAPSGLAFRDATGRVVEVVWPFGYSARREVSGVALIGHKGEVLAHEGDFIEAGGGTGGDDLFRVCDGSVRVVPPPG